jgi:hypothetical protein
MINHVRGTFPASKTPIAHSQISPDRHARPPRPALGKVWASPSTWYRVRLGMVNADGLQELFVYALTRKGRVETTNYRTVKLPTGRRRRIRGRFRVDTC